jgi:ferredoxin-NADP reductase
MRAVPRRARAASAASEVPSAPTEVRSPIGGHFIWRTEDGGPILLFAGGSGVAPLMAMVWHRAAVAPDVPALLVYSARTWEELIFRDELLAAEVRQPAFALRFATTREAPHGAGDTGRRLDRPLLRAILARWGRTVEHAYVCGSNAFIEAITTSLVEESVPAERIRAERFGGAA